MNVAVGTLVTLPGFTPYPRYGRVVEISDEGLARVAKVHCGDPRCAAEHVHGPQDWPVADLEAATAYQPRAPWEYGRKGAPNAVLS